jgi:putative copper export protein
MKILIILVLVAILISLGTGFYYILIDRTHRDRAVKALTTRIALSLSLLIVLMVLSYFGVIQR